MVQLCVPIVQAQLLGSQGWLRLHVQGVPCAELGVLEDLMSGPLARSAEHISFWPHRLRCHQSGSLDFKRGSEPGIQLWALSPHLPSLCISVLTVSLS